MPDAFFTIEGEWFRPTEYARGPWDPNACHAGSPSESRTDAGMDAYGSAPGGRGAVAFPADLSARRLRQRHLAQRRPDPADVRQHGSHDPASPPAGRRVARHGFGV